jgi:hypothetical protein
MSDTSDRRFGVHKDLPVIEECFGYNPPGCCFYFVMRSFPAFGAPIVCTVQVCPC